MKALKIRHIGLLVRDIEKSMKFYAGIGSRKTPANILKIMTKMAEYLDIQKYILRSGAASGADQAFENGTSNKEIYLPQHTTDEAIELASQIHPAWNRCGDYDKKLHGINVQIVLGKDLISPSSFVICWTPNGKKVGGTSLGIRVAEKHNIPVYNLFDMC